LLQEGGLYSFSPGLYKVDHVSTQSRASGMYRGVFVADLLAPGASSQMLIQVAQLRGIKFS
jgi:hypothetical protein